MGIDTDYSSLLTAPIPNVVQTAREISHQASHFLVRKDPFLGLSQDRPVRAVSALRATTFPKNVPKREWETFLNEPCRAEDGSRLTNFIAQILVSYSNDVIAPIIASASEWLKTSSKQLARENQALFNSMLTRIISVLEDYPSYGAPQVHIPHGPRDWASESINSPGGKLVHIPAHREHPIRSNVNT